MERKILPVLTCVILFFAQAVYASSLSSNFGQVRVGDIPIGYTYSMREGSSTPLVLTNTSNFDLDIKIEIVTPEESDLVKGYEAIPDTGWITLEEDVLKLPAQNEVETDVIIDIPDDEKYKGKKYQVTVWSHTVGRATGVGLKGKLLISIAE